MSSCKCDAKNPCCPQFNPEPWQDKEIHWDNKLFLKDHVISFLHMPLNMGCKIMKNMKLIKEAQAAPEGWFMLSDCSLWGSDIYLDVTKEVPGAQMATMSGTFLTKVFEGPYRNTGKWVEEMKEYVKGKGKQLQKIYFYYTTCPKCAKIYGKNYVVLFAKVE